MTRMARVVAEERPHHITQRGNRRQPTFFPDEDYQAYIDLVVCVRYIENNPVRAKLATSPDKWPWRSAFVHMARKNDKLVNVEPELSIISGDWQQFLSGAFPDEEQEEIRKHSRTGRPLGSSAFVAELEHKLGRKLKPQKPGKKRKEK
ncbi:MAG: hypothetical protein SWH68_17175 [Thermodesulfobacteriota bacterium]|nr:hypothetical protein [Thermodesulfobacteriota bacterium]